jgi:hypothetical protein
MLSVIYPDIPHDNNIKMQGIVDQDCRGHGIANLYLPGCSVLPTRGVANPMLTPIKHHVDDRMTLADNSPLCMFVARQLIPLGDMQALISLT